MLRHSSRTAAVLLALLSLAACISADEPAQTHRRYDEFARDFITDFHSHGLAAVRSRVSPATLEGATDPEKTFAEMTGALPSRIDSIHARAGGEIEEGWTSGVGVLHYRVFGPERTADVDIIVERSGREFVVETIRMVPAAWER